MRNLKRILGLALALWLLFSVPSWTQEGKMPGQAEQAPADDLSIGRQWGLGVRYLPSALAPVAPPNPEVNLSSALLLQFWLTRQLGVEVGGWFSRVDDAWSESTLTLITGGLLLKLIDTYSYDFYLAGRGIHARQTSRDKGVFFSPPPEPLNVPPPCCPPFESESVTLAFELAAGVEWSPSALIALDCELSLLYAQTVSTTSGVFPMPEEPTSLQSAQMPPFTSTSTSVGLTLRLGVFFYLPRGLTGVGEPSTSEKGEG